MAFFQNMKQRQQEQVLQSRQRKGQEHGKKSWNEQERQTDDDNNHFSSRKTYTEAHNYNPDQDTDIESDTTSSSSGGEESQGNTNTLRRSSSLLQNIVDDFTPQKGDQKILRAIGRTATVNAAVLVTAATGGAAGAIGYATGGAITTKRLYDGLVAQDEKEVTKSLAVYGAATGASVAGQALAMGVMIGVAGASLPLAGAVAFGVGCCSGVTAGALSEWSVDKCMSSDENKNVGEKLFLKKDCFVKTENGDKE